MIATGAPWHPLGAEDAVGRWGSAMQGGKAPRVPAMAAATFGAMTAPTPQLKAAASLPNPAPVTPTSPSPIDSTAQCRHGARMSVPSSSHTALS